MGKRAFSLFHGIIPGKKRKIRIALAVAPEYWLGLTVFVDYF